ncbi:MraY family glycosyltransferase [Mangrovactinospora gilvigrisea]|nr:MraY family glycosyltransferase [Mangrovactinospora gilvigrisea]
MREYLVLLLVSAAVTYLLTGPLRAWLFAQGIVPAIRARDVHSVPTPKLGGVAMFAGLCAGLLTATHFTRVGRVFADTSDVKALLSGAALIWVLGVVDDRWELDSLLKLGGQVLAAAVMVFQGLKILWVPIPGVGVVALGPLESTLLTVFVIVMTINAVNTIDGVDGLANGVVLIASLAFFLYAYRLWFGYGIQGAAPAALIAAVLTGVCAGFLPHNLPPARIFMGDSGALLIGLVLSVPSISLAGQVDPEFIAAQVSSHAAAGYKLAPFYLPLLLPVVMIGVPVFDMGFAIVRRAATGKHPFRADRGHLHHRLRDRGHGDVWTVAVVYLLSAALCCGVVALSVQSARHSWLLIAMGVLLAAAGLVLAAPRMIAFVRRTPRTAETEGAA